MQANANVVREHKKDSLASDWSVIKQRAKKTLTRERITDTVLVTSSSAILGVILFALHKAMQNFTYTGFGITGYGF